MTLAEKITALRGERKLSQGDVAERLGVSRQSVSKWETAQAVPELDKIIKLADLFGVSVDELVREEDARPEMPPAAQPETKIVYVERRPTGTQAVGVVLLVLGLLGVILGAAVSGNSGTYTAIAGAGMVVLGLPLLLARKHPFVVTGWVVLAVSCLIFNPHFSIVPWDLWNGLRLLYHYLTIPEMNRSPSYLFGASIAIARGVLFLVLAFFTARLFFRARAVRKQSALDKAA